jgi:hypothetical protein
MADLTHVIIRLRRGRSSVSPVILTMLFQAHRPSAYGTKGVTGFSRPGKGSKSPKVAESKSRRCRQSRRHPTLCLFDFSTIPYAVGRFAYRNRTVLGCGRRPRQENNGVRYCPARSFCTSARQATERSRMAAWSARPPASIAALRRAPAAALRSGAVAGSLARASRARA